MNSLLPGNINPNTVVNRPLINPNTYIHVWDKQNPGHKVCLPSMKHFNPRIHSKKNTAGNRAVLPTTGRRINPRPAADYELEQAQNVRVAPVAPAASDPVPVQVTKTEAEIRAEVRAEMEAEAKAEAERLAKAESSDPGVDSSPGATAPSANPVAEPAVDPGVELTPSGVMPSVNSESEITAPPAAGTPAAPLPTDEIKTPGQAQARLDELNSVVYSKLKGPERKERKRLIDMLKIDAE